MNKLHRIIFILASLFILLLGMVSMPAEAKFLGARRVPCTSCCNTCQQTGAADSCLKGNCSDKACQDDSCSVSATGEAGHNYSVPSASGLPLSLSYASNNANGESASLDTGLGFGWSHSYNVYLFTQNQDIFKTGSSGTITKYQRMGRTATYKVVGGAQQDIVANPDGSMTITNRQEKTAFRFAKIPGNPIRVAAIEPLMLVSITDRNGNVTQLSYQNGQLSQVKDAYNRTIQFNYDASRHLSRITDPLGRETTLVYGGYANLVKIVDPLGKTVQYDYDVRHQIVGKTDQNGNQWQYVYNSTGHLVTIRDGAGGTVVSQTNPDDWATNSTDLNISKLRTYLPSTTTRQDGRGNLWKYSYNADGQVIKTIAPDNATTTYTYDSSTLNLASETDANGHRTEYFYDATGNLLRERRYLVYPAANPSQYFDTVYQYEPTYNQVSQITYPNGSITQYAYDAQGNRTQEVRDVGGLNITTHWTYYTASVPGNPSPAAGLLKTQEVHNGASTQTTAYEYDVHGNQIKVTDPELHVARYEYDALGNRTCAIDGNGHAKFYQYDALNRLKQETAKIGVQECAGPDADDIVTAEYDYDGLGNRVETRRQANTATPRVWQTTQFQYDYRNRLVTEIRDPAGPGLATQYAYDANNNRVTMVDPRGKATQYGYDAQNRLATVTDALTPVPNVTETRYDPVGNRVCLIDANGHRTFYEYDALNRLTVESRKIGPQACATGLGDPDDIVMQTFYDAGNAIPPADCKNPQCAGPMPGSASPASRIDPENKYTYFKYDALNRPVMTIRKVGDAVPGDDTGDSFNANDWSQITQYDAAGNVLARYDANGNPTTYTYFNDNLLRTEANALNETTRYTYDGAHNVRSVQSPGGNVTRNVYDARDQLVQVADLVNGPGSLVALYAYDGIGNRVQQCDGNGNCTVYQYDAVNRLLATTDAQAQSSHYQYDNDGNLVKTTDREGKAVCYVYDDINRRIRQVQKVGDADCSAGGGDGDADDVWTKTVYDAVGNVTELTTAKNGGTPTVCNGAAPSADCETTRYFYDEANRLVQEAYPLRQAGDPVKNTREFVYDRAGNLVQRTDQKNLKTFYVYNDLYYLTHRNYDTDPADSFAYDVGGRMIQALRDGWLVTFTYDAANRVLQTAQNGQAVSYAYDIPGRKRTLAYPGGKVVVEQRDLRERLDSLNAGAIAAYTYDLGNRVTARAYGNGSRAAYSYNANNWTTDLSHTKSDTSLIAGFGHDYDKEGNKRYQQNHLDAAPTDCDQAHFPADRAKCSESYHYDDLYRLVHYKLGELDAGGDVPVPLTQSQYALDKLGNWDSKTTTVDANPPVVENRQHNAVNEITQIDAVPIASDADGNLSQDDRYFYAYDQENRLTQAAQIAPPEVVGQYRYDALGRRVAKTLGASRGGTETRYVYDDARIIEEQNTAGSTLAAYTYGNYIDEVLTMDRGGQTYYYHQNTLGSVEAITNSAQVVVERYAYDAYGRPTITDGLGNVLASPWGAAHSAVGNPWMFTGRQYDEEAGLYYYRTRYYDPDKGRFLQRDALGYVDGMNLYWYVQGRPTYSVDPSGHVVWFIVIIAAVAIVALTPTQLGNDELPQPPPPPVNPPAIVRPVTPDIGRKVPGSESNMYNCMRWAVGCGIPTSREWWEGEAVSKAELEKKPRTVWPEEKFLKDRNCRGPLGCEEPCKEKERKVKLYEWKYEDQFHIVRQEKDGTWSAKTGRGPRYEKIADPDKHTAAAYKIKPEDWKATCWCCPDCP